MFSIPKSGYVSTGEKGHAFVFNSTSGKSYIFLGNLAYGVQSVVQLVANMSTKEVVVRKVSRTKLPLTEGKYNLTNSLPEDCEVRILNHLNSLLRQPVNNLNPPVTPRWTTCISHEDIPTLSGGPQPRKVCTRVSYWKLCNGGCLGNWAREPGLSGSSYNGRVLSLPGPANNSYPLPVCIVARCIAQVCETLHFMYNAGKEAVYHCDLHIGNVFLHFDERNGFLPDFYIGDFGWSRIASENLAEGAAMYGSSRNSKTAVNPPAGTVPPGQRRRWDLVRFGDVIDTMVRLGVPSSGKQPLSQHANGLKRLVMMLDFLDKQEAILAANNPRSRPASLLEFIREAKKVEQAALAAEKHTDQFKQFIGLGRQRAEYVMKRLGPDVFPSDPKLPSREKRDRAKDYGDSIVEGPWSLVESI